MQTFMLDFSKIKDFGQIFSSFLTNDTEVYISPFKLLTFATSPINLMISLSLSSSLLERGDSDLSSSDDRGYIAVNWGDLQRLSRQYKAPQSVKIDDLCLRIAEGGIRASLPVRRVSNLFSSEIVSVFRPNLDDSAGKIMNGDKVGYPLAKEDISLLSDHLIHICPIDVFSYVFFSEGRSYSTDSNSLLSVKHSDLEFPRESISFDILKLIAKLNSKKDKEEIRILSKNKYLYILCGDIKVATFSSSDGSGFNLINEIVSLRNKEESPRVELNLARFREEMPESALLDNCRVNIDFQKEVITMLTDSISIERKFSSVQNKIKSEGEELSQGVSSDFLKNLLKLSSHYETLKIYIDDRFIYFCSGVDNGGLDWYLMSRRS